MKYPLFDGQLADLKSAAREFVLPGFVPATPLFDQSDPLWTMGSCFSANIHKAMRARGMNSAHVPMIENVNSPSLLRIFAKALAGKSGTPFSDQMVRDSRVYLTKAKGVVLTLGVAACPDESGTWRKISVASAEDSLRAIINIFRDINPGATIIVTLSPVPIKRSLWGPSAVGADCVSKSALRTAIDQYFDAPRDDVYYWPSFEIVRWLGVHRPGHYGADDGETRHISKGVIDVITTLFIEYWIKPTKGIPSPP